MNKEKMFSFDIKKKVFLGSRQGSILAYSLIILSMMLAIATALSVATILAKKSASGTEFSVQSLQTADSGVQLALKQINNNLGKRINDNGAYGAACTQPGGVATILAQSIPNAGTYELSFYKDGGATKLNCNDLMGDIEVIKSVGVYRDTVRVITVAVAAPPCAGKTTLEDIRGTETITYPIVEIGDQCWMAENLHTKLRPDGTALEPWTWNEPIPGNDYFCCSVGSANCSAQSCGAPRWQLYTWSAAMNTTSNKNTTLFDYSTLVGLGLPPAGTDSMKVQGLCPIGWHIPSHDDMNNLDLYVNTLANDAGELRLAGTTLWQPTNTGGTNSTNFAAVPAGLFSSAFYNYNTYANFWSSKQLAPADAEFRMLVYTNNFFAQQSSTKVDGMSIRCIKD